MGNKFHGIYNLSLCHRQGDSSDQRLLNVEFDWDPDHLSYQPPVEGLPIPTTIDMVKKAISQMKAGKAPGPTGIVVEMIRAAVMKILERIVDSWCQSTIPSMASSKAEALQMQSLLSGSCKRSI